MLIAKYYIFKNGLRKIYLIGTLLIPLFLNYQQKYTYITKYKNMFSVVILPNKEEIRRNQHSDGNPLLVVPLMGHYLYICSTSNAHILYSVFSQF